MAVVAVVADEASEVRLRPVTDADLPLLLRWRKDEERESLLFFGYRRLTLREDFTSTGLLGEDRGLLVVARRDEPLGEVSWHVEAYGRNAGSRCLNVGIRLAPEHRGRGYGTLAQRLLAEYLFGTYPVNRLEAGTDVTNVAQQRALEKAGFRREGVLRGAQWRAGRYHDLALYSRLRGD